MSTKSRRLRKKLYLDEFAILGFEFTCNLNATEEEFDLLLDELLDFINKNKGVKSWLQTLELKKIKGSNLDFRH